MAFGDGVIMQLVRLFGGDTAPLRPGEPPKAAIDAHQKSFGMQGYFDKEMGRKSGHIYPEIARKDLLSLLDEMDRSGLISSVLDMQSDDACATDPDTGNAITIEGPPRLRNEIAGLFTRLKLEEKTPSIVRTMCKHGNAFRRTVYSRQDGISNLIATPTEDVEIVMDPDTDLIKGYKQRGRKFRDKSQDVSWPWDFIDFRMAGKDESSIYGTGVIEPGLRTFTQLMIAEDFALMYRVTRQPDRLVFDIDIGSAPESEGTSMVQEFRRSMRRSSIIDPLRAVLRQEWRQQTPLDDIFLGKRPNSATNIRSLPGSTNTQDVTDLNYFTKKLLLECNTPPSLFGYQDTATTTEPVNRQKRITNQDVRYANHIRRIQKSHIAALMRLCEIHLTLRASVAENPGYFEWRGPNEESMLRLGMRVPDFLEELERMEILQLRNTIAAEMLNMLPASGGTLKPYEWTAHVLTNIVRIPEDRVLQLTQELPAMEPGPAPGGSQRGKTDKKKNEAAELIRHAHAFSLVSPLTKADEIVQLNETIVRSQKLQAEIRRARSLFRGTDATQNS